MTYTSKGARALQALTAKHGRPVDWPEVAPALSPLILRRLRTLRADNAHGIAYAVAAEALGLDALRVKLEDINAQHHRRGWLTPELSTARNAAYDELLTEARRLLSADEFAALYACF